MRACPFFVLSIRMTPALRSDAIEDAPIAMLDPEYLATVVEERARAANPAAWTELEDLQMLEGAAHALISAARVALGPDVDQAPQMIAAVA